MARRGSRLRRKMRKRTRLGYWKIPKRGAVPSRDVLAELRFRKLDLQKFRRTKNGDM